MNISASGGSSCRISISSAKEQSNKEQVPRKPSGKVSHSYRTDPKNRGLQADLLILLDNDVPAAKRLLLQQRQRNPGKSDNWYLEKVIYDLERDRQ
ncbi:hypothetical protein [Nostoc sp.]|uniref:hypothetical protein n=1 Tax=Nostoc sp. TaxID=1180 RepID=UPI002FFC131F